MANTIINCHNINELPSVAKQIVELYPEEKLFLFFGKMGAGKTTIIKEICSLLDVIDVVNSPTFSIVNEYRTATGKSVYHFDLYRIKSPIELMDIGYEEYIFGDSVCLIEWPELAADLLPASFVMIKIEVDELTSIRTFDISLEKNN